MNTTPKITDRERLKSELAVYVRVYNAYKDVIGLNEPKATKLAGKMLGAIGEVLRQVQRLEKEIAKMQDGKQPS